AWQAFLTPNAETPENIFAEHLRGQEKRPRLTPDGFAYRIALRSGEEGPGARAVVARSVTPRFPKSVYVDLTLDYDQPREPDQFAERAVEDFYTALESVGFKIASL